MAQHSIAWLTEAQRDQAEAWVIAALQERIAGDPPGLACVLVHRAQCNTEEGLEELIRVSLRLLAGLEPGSTAEPRPCLPTLVYGSFETQKQESRYEVAIVQVVGLRDLPQQLQDEAEKAVVAPPAKRQRTEAAAGAGSSGGGGSGGGAAGAGSSGEAAAQPGPGSPSPAEPGSPAAQPAEPGSPGGAAAAERPPEEVEAAVAEAQLGLMVGHGMAQVLPVAVMLGRDRVLRPQLRRWARRLLGPGADFTDPDLALDSAATVFKEHYITHVFFEGPPAVVGELIFAMLHGETTQRDVQAEMRRASRFHRPLRPPLHELSHAISAEDLRLMLGPEAAQRLRRMDQAADAARGPGSILSRPGLARAHFLGITATDGVLRHRDGKVVAQVHSCMISDAAYPVHTLALTGQLSSALLGSRLGLAPWHSTPLRPPSTAGSLGPPSPTAACWRGWRPSSRRGSRQSSPASTPTGCGSEAAQPLPGPAPPTDSSLSPLSALYEGR